MRLLSLLFSAVLIFALALPAMAAEDQWSAEMEDAYQAFIHPGAPKATDVLYFVPSKEAAADYYSELFGFPLLWIEPSGPAFLMIDQQVSLSLLDIHEYGPPGWQEGDPLPSSMLGFQVEDVEAQADKLRDGGCELKMVHEADYVKVYVATDPMYHHSFMFLQLKDSDSTRELFGQMMAGSEH